MGTGEQETFKRYFEVNELKFFGILKADIDVMSWFLMTVVTQSKSLSVYGV